MAKLAKPKSFKPKPAKSTKPRKPSGFRMGKGPGGFPMQYGS